MSYMRDMSNMRERNLIRLPPHHSQKALVIGFRMALVAAMNRRNCDEDLVLEEGHRDFSRAIGSDTLTNRGF